MSKITALYFTASWCQPCKALKPYAIKAFETKGLDYQIIDVDKDPETADYYEVSSVPNIAFIKFGQKKPVARVIGAHVPTFNKTLDEVTNGQGNPSDG